MLEETAVEMKWNISDGWVLFLLRVSLGVAPPWGVFSEHVPSPAHPCPTSGPSVALGAGVSLRWLAPWVSPKLSMAGQRAAEGQGSSALFTTRACRGTTC